MKILVIDDDESVRWAVRISLRKHGYAVLEAGDGEEGLKLAQSGLPDLILCDVVMRRMDGFQVLKALRSQSDTSVIPVILMTGVPERGDVRYSMERGADDYLAKPFAQEALIAAIQARLERQRTIQAQAKNNETKLLELLSATHDLIAIVDPVNGQLLYLNNAGKKMLGLSVKGVPGLHLTDFITESGVAFKNKIAHAEKEGIWIGESGFVRRDGQSVPVSVQILMHRPADGKPAYLSIVARDISERKRVETKLAETHQELLKASRQAGMAEVATGVLHNVGNVLNSINVASSCIARSLKQSRAPSLSKIATLLQQHQSDVGTFLTSDAKGKQIPVYLSQLSEHLINEQDAALKELAELQKNIQHVKDIVTMQQNYARVSGVTEMLKINDLVEDVLRLTLNEFSNKGVQVIREFDGEVTATLERHKVLQILVNLVRNAKQACETAQNPDKRIHIKAAQAKGWLRISVTDTGIGISAENLKRLFQHGFTTKKNGHGFGLHSSLQAAHEMNGNLTVHSDGPGMGATFTLELPNAPNTTSNN